MRRVYIIEYVTRFFRDKTVRKVWYIFTPLKHTHTYHKKTIFTVAAVGEMQSALNFWCLLPLLYFYDVCGIEQLWTKIPAHELLMQQF